MNKEESNFNVPDLRELALAVKNAIKVCEKYPNLEPAQEAIKVCQDLQYSLSKVL